VIKINESETKKGVTVRMERRAEKSDRVVTVDVMET
jgi:hypothetical protein